MINDRNDDLMMLVMTVRTIAETEQDHNVLKMTIGQRWQTFVVTAVNLFRFPN